jgi:hypothetical protein
MDNVQIWMSGFYITGVRKINIPRYAGILIFRTCLILDAQI